MASARVTPVVAGDKSGIPVRCDLSWHEPDSDSPAVMTSTHSSFAAFLEELCADYRSSLPQQLEQIESLWR